MYFFVNTRLTSITLIIIALFTLKAYIDFIHCLQEDLQNV